MTTSTNANSAKMLNHLDGHSFTGPFASPTTPSSKSLARLVMVAGSELDAIWMMLMSVLPETQAKIS